MRQSAKLLATTGDRGAHLRLAIIEAPCRFDPVDFPPPQKTVRRKARARSCLPVCRSAGLPACLPACLSRCSLCAGQRPAASGPSPNILRCPASDIDTGCQLKSPRMYQEAIRSG